MNLALTQCDFGTLASLGVIALSREMSGLVAVLPVELYNLPDYEMATLYRAILRAFHERQG
ncbi:MAG TPA: hypothetical protein VK879_17510 [Candidatus Sulfomarinibacteraceae bacterium]|nr:hypothetical protein [Candidatus Sulfomarinibacteraceae bacterium]